MNFAFEASTEVLGSCSANYMGHMYVFGGSKETKQISEIDDCSLKRLGSLDFDMETGTCGVFNLEGVNDELLLCFSGTSDKKCIRFDGTDGQEITNMAEWTAVVESRHHHKKSRLANYKGKPFIVGSRGTGTADNKHTELLQKMAGTLSWAGLRDYPYGTYFGGSISGYATASTASAAYILGGFEHATATGHALDIIAKYENDSWSKVGGPTGGLLAKRYGHNAIWMEDELFVIGGHQTKQTEKWSQGLGLTKIEHQLTGYEYYPELFVVPETFCSK